MNRNAILETPRRIERAVDLVFRAIGAGMTHTRAVPYVAEDMGVNANTLRAAYDVAINKASESD